MKRVEKRVQVVSSHLSPPAHFRQPSMTTSEKDAALAVTPSDSPTMYVSLSIYLCL